MIRTDTEQSQQVLALLQQVLALLQQVSALLQQKTVVDNSQGYSARSPQVGVGHDSTAVQQSPSPEASMPSPTSQRVYYIEGLPSRDHDSLVTSYVTNNGREYYFQVSIDGTVTLREGLTDNDKRALISELGHNSILLVKKMGQGSIISRVIPGKVSIDIDENRQTWTLTTPLTLELT